MKIKTFQDFLEEEFVLTEKVKIPVGSYVDKNTNKVFKGKLEIGYIENDKFVKTKKTNEREIESPLHDSHKKTNSHKTGSKVEIDKSKSTTIKGKKLLLDITKDDGSDLYAVIHSITFDNGDIDSVDFSLIDDSDRSIKYWKNTPVENNKKVLDAVYSAIEEFYEEN